MKSKILWKAKKTQINKSNLFRYEKFLFSKYKFKVTQKYLNSHSWIIKFTQNKFIKQNITSIS